MTKNEVQVLRDPAEDKGAKLTTRVNLAGVNLVFRPGHPGVSVSRRIEDEGERDRLTAAIEALAPLSGRFIVRTAASGVAEDALGTEVRALNRQWKDICLRRANAKKLGAWLSSHALWDAPPFDVDAFTLYSSILGPSGSKYTPEVRYPLRTP